MKSIAAAPACLPGVDVTACADAFALLATDEALRRRLGESGRRHVREHYDWSVVVRQYQELWSELAERRRQAGEVAPRRPGRSADPLRPDPFRLFSGYSSACLTPDSRVAMLPGGSDRAVAGIACLAAECVYSASGTIDGGGNDGGIAGVVGQELCDSRRNNRKVSR